MMKHIFTLLLLVVSIYGHSQSKEKKKEEIVRTFESMLIDYEFHNSHLVALTKRGLNYSIHYTDLKGKERVQVLEINDPSKIEVGCHNRMYIVSFDSAFQIKINVKVEILEGMTIDAYNENVQNCIAVFDQSIVLTAPNNTISFNWLNQTKDNFEGDPFLLNIWSGDDVSDQDLEKETTPESNENTGYSSPVPKGNGNNNRTWGEVETPKRKSSELRAFKCNDSLWVFDVTGDVLLTYGQNAALGAINTFATYSEYLIEQDRATGVIYITAPTSGNCKIRRIDRYGDLTEVLAYNRSSFTGNTKIYNGYLYFMNSLNIGYTIYRIKLD